MRNCLECGLCCCSNDPKWIEVTQKDALYMIDRYYLQDGNIEAYAMRMVDGRCIALKGNPGLSCFCSIYPNRPEICRRVMQGCEICKVSLETFNVHS